MAAKLRNKFTLLKSSIKRITGLLCLIGFALFLISPADACSPISTSIGEKFETYDFVFLAEVKEIKDRSWPEKPQQFRDEVIIVENDDPKVEYETEIVKVPMAIRIEGQASLRTDKMLKSKVGTEILASFNINDGNETSCSTEGPSLFAGRNYLIFANKAETAPLFRDSQYFIVEAIEYNPAFLPLLHYPEYKGANHFKGPVYFAIGSSAFILGILIMLCYVRMRKPIY